MNTELCRPLEPTAVRMTKPRPQFSDLLKLAEPRGERFLLAGVLALLGHGAFGFVAVNRPPPEALAPPPVEVEMTFREPPPPPPEEPLPEAPEPPRAEAPQPVVAKPAPPPPAARAGAVLTAKPEAVAAAASEPFDFTSDPNSTVYGSGVVAVGGTATHGLAGARVGGEGKAPAPASRGDGLTSVSDLSQRPRLRVADPCRGFFPEVARADVATVSVRVVIGKNGKVSQAQVVSESPKGQGFGAAARACMLDQVFVPAQDKAGNAAAVALPVNVRFSR